MVSTFKTKSAYCIRVGLLILLGALGGTPTTVSALGDSTVTYKSRTAYTTTTSTSLTLNPISVAKYDTVILFYWTGAANPTLPSPPTDSNGCVYTLLQTAATSSTNYYGTSYICASEPATNASMFVTVTTGAASPGHSALGARVYSGVNNTTPVDVKASTTATGSGTAIPSSSLTTTVANDRIVFAGMQYNSFSGTYTVGSGWGNDGTTGAAFSSSHKDYCDDDKAAPTATTYGSVTGCTFSGTSPFGYSSITFALQPGACTTGQTGTYPNCVTPDPTPTVTHVVCDNCTNVDIHYLHQLAIKGFAFAIACITGIALIYPFRYRGGSDA